MPTVSLGAMRQRVEPRRAFERPCRSISSTAPQRLPRAGCGLVRPRASRRSPKHGVPRDAPSTSEPQPASSPLPRALRQRKALAVDLAENDILCPNYGDNIREHMSLCHEIKALKVTEARGADMAACVTAS